MLTIVFVIHDSAGITVNDIGKLLLRHTLAFPLLLDLTPYIVEIKPPFVSFNLHNITQCNFIFRMLVFERFAISCNHIFNFISHG